MIFIYYNFSFVYIVNMEIGNRSLYLLGDSSFGRDFIVF